MKGIATIVLLVVMGCGSKDAPEKQPATGSSVELDKDRERAKEAAEATEQVRAAETASARARADAEAASKRMEDLGKESDQLNKEIEAGMAAVMDAQTDADRAKAKQTLTELQQKKAELEKRIADEALRKQP